MVVLEMRNQMMYRIEYLLDLVDRAPIDMASCPDYIPVISSVARWWKNELRAQMFRGVWHLFGPQITVTVTLQSLSITNSWRHCLVETDTWTMNFCKVPLIR